ncbi:ABC-three component system protein [Pantoea ananatis]|uniref:ABC-three component system protein n=1 Tax=Pantoea ananas TaxID=553 RepID=UPI0021E737CD|nr:ABC-three component system protein [Pantoea ananatis]MCV3298427.1 hypothetical protein [Pantoea ananatis]
MAEDIKSALHDATPSWNGFNYQGKVGLYVCLKNIRRMMDIHPIGSKCFNDFLDSHSIEYEWIEDFSIKNGRDYVSLHQVKHKAGANFSEHISAIVTILNRKIGRLSETDFVKYISLDVDYNDCVTPQQRADKKLSVIHSKLQLLIQHQYLDPGYTLHEHWENNKQNVPGMDSDEIESLLSNFSSFSSRTFGDSRIYFHTSEEVLPPIKAINEYAGVPEYLHESVRSLRTLSSLNIFLAYDNPVDYELKLSDDVLNVKINSLLAELLGVIHPSEDFSGDDLALYCTALIDVIDKHILKRHSNIRNKSNIGEGFQEKREQLLFSSIFEPLNDIIKNQNKKHWEFFCKKSFENTYSEYIEFLSENIDANPENKDKFILRKNNLDKYRRDVLTKYSCSDLLSMLSPHQLNDNSLDVFYSKICNEHLLRTVFLKFVQELSESGSDLVIKDKSSLAYHPSTITFISDDDDDFRFNIMKVKYNINKNNNFPMLFNSSHLVVQTRNGQDISEESVGLLTIVETINKEQTVDYQYKANNVVSLKFISIDDAVRAINND